MKIGILTFPNSPSFGASLQMYALFKALQNMEVDVEVINYINQFMKAQRHINSKKSLKEYIKHYVASVLNFHGSNEFKKFEREVKLYPTKPMHDPEQLRKIADRYDYLICGSDQVWNPFITNNDVSFFLDFCNNNSKKIAYAPSFGLNTLPVEYKNIYRHELKCFHRLSAREEAGQNIISELIGLKVPLVLDPSMLLKKDEWRKCIKRVNGLPPKYIAKFIFNHDVQVENFINDLSRERGIPVIVVGGNSFSFLKGIKSTGAIGPREWLYTIMNAESVVTDSFHGAAFSIIFEKDLYISTASSTNSRLVTLSKLFGLENRIIQKNIKKEITKAIDYSSVKKIMERERNASLNYLREAININYGE